MARVRAAAVCVGVLASSAAAGVVTFDPPAIEVTLAERGTRNVYVGLDLDGAAFDGVSLLVGSDDIPIVAAGLAVFCDPYSCFFPTDGPLLTPDGPGVYSHEAYWAGNAYRPPIVWERLPLLVVTIDLSSVEIGDYSLTVDTERDGGVSGVFLRGKAEPLVGSMTVAVVPEPATFSFILVATVVLGRVLLRGKRPSALDDPGPYFFS